MELSSVFFAAWLVGLTGGVHCFGMCGGIVGAITWGLPSTPDLIFRGRWAYLLAYNSGRLASYVSAGMLAGGIGAWAVHLADVHRVQLALQILAGLFMILLGFYIGGWWRVLGRLEAAGGRLWRRIEPLGRRWLPVRTLGQALGVGLVWGWLPCGLVYSVLVWAIGSGGAVQGGLLLLSFGLGTLPALLAMGTAASVLAGFLRRVWVRYIAGALIAAFGGYKVWVAVAAGAIS